MRSLGGEVPRCFTVTESWRGAASRCPGRCGTCAATACSRCATATGPSSTACWTSASTRPASATGGAGIRCTIWRTWSRCRCCTGCSRPGWTSTGATTRAARRCCWVLWDGGSGDLVRRDARRRGRPDRRRRLQRHRAAHAAFPRRATVPALAARGRTGPEVHDEYGRTPLLTQVISRGAGRRDPGDCRRPEPTRRRGTSTPSSRSPTSPATTGRTTSTSYRTSEESDGDDRTRPAGARRRAGRRDPGQPHRAGRQQPGRGAGADRGGQPAGAAVG